jgi:RND family efflux transporter MFP subunit
VFRQEILLVSPFQHPSTRSPQFLHNVSVKWVKISFHKVLQTGGRNKIINGRKYMNKKWWIVIATTVVLIAVGIFGWRSIAAGKAEAQAPQGENAVVRRGALAVAVDATGSLTPHSQVSLAFETGGRVAEVLVEEGQFVKAGQPLVRLETDELELQVTQAEAALAGARAQLAQLTASPRPEEVAIKKANLQAMQAQVSATAANRDQVADSIDAAQITAAQAQVASAQAQQKVAQDTYDRAPLGTREEQARYSLHAADVALAAAQAQLDKLLAGADPELVRAAQANVAAAVAQRDVAQAQLDLLLAGPREEQVQAAQAAVDQACVAMDQAQLHLKKATLTAPADSTVATLRIEPGEWASPGQPVIVLSDLAAMEVDVNLDETDVAEVMVGQNARLMVDAFPGVELTGEVTTIAPVAQVQAGVVLYPVTIRLKLAEPSTDAGRLPTLRAGMTADVTIITANREDALIVPLRAVKTEGEHAYIDRLVGGQVERAEVKLGMMTETEVEVTSGVTEGDVVVVVAVPTQGSGESLPGPLRMLVGGK